MTNKESIYTAFNDLREAFNKFEKEATGEFCWGHGCIGECEFSSDTEFKVYSCYLCRINEIIRSIERALDNHKWPEDMPKVRELTVAEVEDILGYPVKIVKE